MRKLLFTGATGMIGTPLLARIRQLHPDLSIRVATPDAPPPGAGVEWIRTDFIEPTVDFDALVAGVDIVYHFGAETSPEDKNFQRVNVEATRELAQAAERAGTVRHFLYTSTSMAYGYPASRIVPDEQSLAAPPYLPDRDPLKAYAISKYDSEKAIEAIADCVTYVILRPVTVSKVDTIETTFAGMSRPRKLWWSHRTWHFITTADAVVVLARFLDEKVWQALPRISYFNFSDDDASVRMFDHFYPGRRRGRVRSLALSTLSWLDIAKDLVKYRHTRPAWSFGLCVYQATGLRRIGLAPTAHRLSGR